MAGSRDRPEAGPRNEGAEAATLLEWQPAVLFAPEDLGWAAHLAVAPLDVVGETLVKLNQLTVEGGLAFGPQPRPEIGSELVIGKRAREGAANIGREDGPVHVGR